MGSTENPASDAVRRQQRLERFESALREGMIAGLDAERSGHVKFVQIGGNDGSTADPLLAWHARQPWVGTIIEPVPAYFAQLEQLHRDSERIKILNCAVSDEDGELTLWMIEPQTLSKYWTFAKGLASTDPAHLRRHHIAEPDIVSVVVPCLSPDTLCKKVQVEALDLLCIDVEGHEAAILLSFPFDRIGVDLTILEVMHMPNEVRSAVADSVAEKGMCLYCFGEDAYIIPKNNLVCCAILEAMQVFYRELLSE